MRPTRIMSRRPASRSYSAGDFVLIDMWSKLQKPSSVYYDITWTGFCGDSPPSEMRNVFGVVTGGRDAAIQFVQRSIADESPLQDSRLMTWREAISSMPGSEDTSFIEQDTRSALMSMEPEPTWTTMKLTTSGELSRRTCFSIEPGVYLPTFGIRSEVNVYVGEKDARVTGEVQTALLVL